MLFIRIDKRSFHLVLFFSKHDILKCFSCSPGQCISPQCISPKMYHIKEVFHPNWLFGLHILYNHFCVLSFHSDLCFPNDYHMVKEQ